MKQVQDKSGNNIIDIARTARIFDDFVVGGQNNTIMMKDGARFKNGKISVRGRNNTLIIGRHVQFTGHIRIIADGASVIIGDGSTFMGAVISAHEPANITIGKDCMFSDHIQMHASDMHSIHDRSTGLRINHGADITVGNHVWVGTRVYISKGSDIGDGAILGAASFVSGTVPAHTASAGVPARVIRENVAWSRRMTDRIPGTGEGAEIDDHEAALQAALGGMPEPRPQRAAGASHLRLVAGN